ncbi:DUF159 family protein [Agaricicola taiwanensis]|uniref:Abasic site processing protein n=1 Tax=Agaricicola taiwanensis TaxID=591372 RepID=A0A8J2YJA2_9RHOB|nr:SOS response-associated peptidase [Agaricicola taiwanensis]GGE45779.1 DUF159 family protein [Agaricicola taiwanensis]
MCGRLAQVLTPAKAAEIFDVAEALPNAAPLYNAPPTSSLMVIRQNPATGRCHLDMLRWGLIPSRSRDMTVSSSLMNARSETVASKPSFRGAWKASRRCIIPADAFYEWKRNGDERMPFAVAHRDRSPMAFAGLWENWKDPADGAWVRSFTILTRPAGAPIDSIHHRMPVILPQEAWKAWLTAGPVPPTITAELPMPDLVVWPVSSRVNAVKNTDAGLLDPVSNIDGPSHQEQRQSPVENGSAELFSTFS